MSDVKYNEINQKGTSLSLNEQALLRELVSKLLNFFHEFLDSHKSDGNLDERFMICAIKSFVASTAYVVSLKAGELPTIMYLTILKSIQNMLRDSLPAATKDYLSDRNEMGEGA
jgi:uncharacterized protein YybS (DUF2232 family)